MIIVYTFNDKSYVQSGLLDTQVNRENVRISHHLNLFIYGHYMRISIQIRLNLDQETDSSCNLITALIATHLGFPSLARVAKLYYM